jgi:hypothetical protein
MKRLILALLVALISCILGTECLAGQGPTKVKIFAPFAGNELAKGLSAGAHVSGSCWEGSLGDPGRADAWRCMVGNYIYDPCFDGHLGDRHVVACGDPFSSKVTVVNLSSSLPAKMGNRDQGTKGLPFGIQLADGAHCLMISGMTTTVKGMRLNYGCDKNGEAAYGDPDRSSPTWTIFMSSQSDATLRHVDVAEVWS